MSSTMLTGQHCLATIPADSFFPSSSTNPYRQHRRRPLSLKCESRQFNISRLDSNNNAIIKPAKRAVATAASIDASMMLLAQSLVEEFLRNEIRECFSYAVGSMRSHLAMHTILVEEMEGLSQNQVYDAVSTYLASRITTSLKRIRVSKTENQEEEGLMLSLEPGEEIIDDFEGGQFKWRLLCREEEKRSGFGRQRNGSRNEDVKTCTYELSFDKRYKDMVLSSYLPYIQDAAKAIKAGNRTLMLYTNGDGYWSDWNEPIDLHHPATFDTVAMDLDLLSAVMDDLARFVKRKDYYKKIGKAWKRGYLLYGPPGTGKSSLIAAMANYLKFDIYYLDLGKVGCDSKLRRLLVGMTNRSIIAIEDIDCTAKFNRDVADKSEGTSKDSDDSDDDEKEKVTLSGLLNFVDGLWSSCGEERIIVFTTNYKDRLDPALLRPGRMDKHIYMGHCTMSAFRVLASNYQDLDDHPLFDDFEGLMKEVEVTPAEVAEEMLRSDDEEIALRGLLDFLQSKKEVKADSINDSDM